MDDCNCKSSLISPSVVLNATMIGIPTIFCPSKVPTIFQDSYFNSNSRRWVVCLWIIMSMEQCHLQEAENHKCIYIWVSPVAQTVIFKKRQEIKGGTFRSSVKKQLLNNWEVPTVILFLNKQEIDICESSVASASSSENWMRKQRQSWWGFLNLNIFECVSVTRCQRFSCHSKLSETNMVESIADQKAVAMPFAYQSELTVQP